MGYPAIKRRRLYEDIASSLEQMIRDADFLPGDQLPSERELMVRFGVGRPACARRCSICARWASSRSAPASGRG